MKKKAPFFLSQKFMGLFLVTIMALSLVGVFSSQIKEETEKEYRGTTFYPINNIWFTYYNGKQVAFNYLPQELENITSVPYVNIQAEKVYLIQDPNVKNISIASAKQKIAAMLFEKNIRPVEACSQENNCPVDYPIKDCATLDTPAIFFKTGEETKITKEYMCYVIESDTSLNLYKATERLIYQIIGVME